MGEIRFLGHASFEIVVNDVICFIDPFFGDRLDNMPRRVPASTNAHQIRKADLILLTHEHEGHCEIETIEEIVDRTHATVIAPKPALMKLNISERFKVAVRAGEAFSIKGIDIEVVNAVHPQSAYPVGYLIKGREGSVYHCGDTYEFTGIEDVKADYVLMPIGGTYTMDVISAIKICKLMRPPCVIPMHYDTHERIMQDPNELINNVAKTRILVLKPGESIKV